MAQPLITNSTTIRWIEKLLQTSIDDYRKIVVWRILTPYFINIRKCSVGTKKHNGLFRLFPMQAIILDSTLFLHCCLFYEGNTPMVNSGEEEGDGDLYEEIREQRVRVSLQD